MSLTLTSRGLLALILTLTVGTSLATGPAIGLAVVKGSFTIDNASVRGNATIFDGSAVKTSLTGSRLQLNNGPEMLLAAQSSARVYQAKAILESGAGQLKGSRNYHLEAAGLQIWPADQATARVQFSGRNSVVVAAGRGAVQVRNSAGVLVARVDPGMALSLTPQGAAAPTKVTGCIVRKAGKLVLVDETTNVVFELQGSGIDKEAGNRAEVAGTASPTAASVEGASQVLKVTSVKQVSKGGCAAVAQKIGAAGAAGAAAGAGAAVGSVAGAAGAAGAATAAGVAGATVAVVGGVAAAATVGGLAAAGTFSGEDEEPKTSR